MYLVINIIINNIKYYKCLKDQNAIDNMNFYNNYLAFFLPSKRCLDYDHINSKIFYPLFFSYSKVCVSCSTDID